MEDEPFAATENAATIQRTNDACLVPEFMPSFVRGIENLWDEQKHRVNAHTCAPCGALAAAWANV